ncbi:MAG TPA: low molecular weight phosphatase family protein [Candidatus Acidoferrum sp.]|nr:low molecular weight phosphatase family protein [Candidatus Acidoferrum sp.]
MFVCLGNACRSPMAEAIARRDDDDVIEASSAGLSPLGRVEKMTKKTLVENGYSAEGLESKPILLTEFDEADLVVNMSGQAKELAFDDSSKVEDWQVEDPYGEDAEVYQRIFKDIEKRVAKLAERLRSARGNRGATTAGRNVGHGKGTRKR